MFKVLIYGHYVSNAYLEQSEIVGELLEESLSESGPPASESTCEDEPAVDDSLEEIDVSDWELASPDA